MALTEEANRIVEGALGKAKELNIRVSVAVCDAGGRLVAFQRMTNAIWASAYGSQGKAVASARGHHNPLAPGQYTYTFKTKATGFDPTATNTIGIYGSRNLTTYNLGTDYASTTFNFVPNGSPVVTTRDVIRNVSCDRCHDQLSAHGGSRRGITLCVMCHHAAKRRSEHREPSRPEGHGAQDPHGFVVAERDRRHAVSNRRISEQRQRFLESGRSGHGAALHGLPRSDDRRRAGYRVFDQAHASDLRIVPRQRELRDRRESPGGRVPGLSLRSTWLILPLVAREQHTVIANRKNIPGRNHSDTQPSFELELRLAATVAGGSFAAAAIWRTASRGRRARP